MKSSRRSPGASRTAFATRGVVPRTPSGVDRASHRYAAEPPARTSRGGRWPAHV
ncbi:Uncharacterised protein [Mycobacteroides abscessus]|nr:Uncharacterised protein [Mycobacteroides abscessus]